MSAIPVDVHGSTQHVVELASTADVGEGAETIDMDTLCASGVAGIDAQACVPTDVPEGCEREPNKFCVMHPDPTCASRLKLCEECTRYMYSDASLSQRRHLTACLSAPDRERAHEPHPSAPNPHRLDMFHLPRGANAGLCEIRDYDEARVRAFALKKIIDRGKRDMHYLVANYKHVEKETAFLERWCERNKLGELSQMWESLGLEPPQSACADIQSPIAPSDPSSAPVAKLLSTLHGTRRESPALPLPAAAPAAPAARMTDVNNNDTRTDANEAARSTNKFKNNGKKGKGVQNRNGGETRATGAANTNSAPKPMSSVSRTGTDSQATPSAVVPSAPQTVLIPCDAVSEGCLVATPEDLPPEIVGIAPGDVVDTLLVADTQNAQVKLLDLKNRGVSVVYEVEKMQRIGGFGRVESTSPRATFIMTISSEQLLNDEVLLLETNSPPPAQAAPSSAVSAATANAYERLANSMEHSTQQHRLRIVERVLIERSRERERDRAIEVAANAQSACVACLDVDRAALAFIGHSQIYELWFNRCRETDDATSAALNMSNGCNAKPYEPSDGRSASPNDSDNSPNCSKEERSLSEMDVSPKSEQRGVSSNREDHKGSRILVSTHELPALVRGLCTGIGGLLAVALSDNRIRVFSRSTIYAITCEEGTRHDPSDPHQETLSPMACLLPLGGPISPLHSMALVATEDKRGIFVFTRFASHTRNDVVCFLEKETAIELYEVSDSNSAKRYPQNEAASSAKLSRAKTKEEQIEDLDVPSFVDPRRVFSHERGLELRAPVLLSRAGRYGADLVAAFDGRTRSLRIFQIV